MFLWSMTGTPVIRPYYHGHDGFGDVPDPNAPDASLIQKENAIQAMLRIANEHQGWDCFWLMDPCIYIVIKLYRVAQRWEHRDLVA